MQPNSSGDENLCRQRHICSLAGLSLHLGDVLAHTEVLDQSLESGVSLHLDVFDLNLGSLGDEVHLALSFFLLESERDASDGSLLDSLHQMGGETGNLVAESLGLDGGDVIDDTLVNMEIGCKPTKTRQIGLTPTTRSKVLNTYFP